MTCVLGRLKPNEAVPGVLVCHQCGNKQANGEASGIGTKGITMKPNQISPGAIVCKQCGTVQANGEVWKRHRLRRDASGLTECQRKQAKIRAASVEYCQRRAKRPSVRELARIEGSKEDLCVFVASVKQG